MDSAQQQAAVSLDGAAGSDGARAKRYSKHLLRLISGTAALPSTAINASPTLSEGERTGESVAESGYFAAALSSEAEVRALVLLERLHFERMRFHLTAAVLFYAPSDSPPPEVKVPKGRNSAHRVICVDRALTAAASALRDFPLNRYFQSVLTTLTVAQPGGYLQMRAYFRSLAQNRLLWGGGLQACECLLLVQLEIFQACKLLQYDPACPAQAVGVDLYALFDANGLTSSLSSAHDAKTNRQSGVLSLCGYWSADSASRVRTVLEYVLSTPTGSQLPSLWMFYIFMLTARDKREEAKKVFFRAVNHCGWCQKLILLSMGPLRRNFTDKEVTSLQSMLEQRGLALVRDAN